jgi:ferredoxin
VINFQKEYSVREECWETVMKVKVDGDLCQGHNRCCALAPNVFDVDDFGEAFALNDGNVAAGEEENARQAIDNCPEFAIKIIEE